MVRGILDTNIFQTTFFQIFMTSTTRTFVRERTLGIVGGIAATVLFVFAVSAMVVRAEGAALFSLSASKTVLKAGEAFKVTVSLDPKGSVIDVARAALSLTNVDVVKVSPSSLFSNEVPENQVNSKAGIVKHARFSFAPGVSKAGTFITLDLKAKAKGNIDIMLTSESEAIQAGENKLNKTKLAKLELGVGGPYKKQVAVVAPAPKPVPAPAAVKGLTTAAIQKIFKALKLKYDIKNVRHAMFVEYLNGKKPEKRVLKLEQQAVKASAKVKSYKGDAYWNIIRAMAYACDVVLKCPQGAPAPKPAAQPVVEVVPVPAVVPAPAPASAKTSDVSFTTAELTSLFKRFGVKYNAKDVVHIALVEYLNGKKPEKRVLKKEQAAVTAFVKYFKRLPKQAYEWNIVRAMAYQCGLVSKCVVSKVVAPSVPAPAAPVVTPTPVVPVPAAAPAPSLPASVSVQVVVPASLDAALEAKAKEHFVALMKRDPTGEEDMQAVRAIAYGVKVLKGDPKIEEDALTRFKKLFGKEPTAVTLGKNILLGLAYIKPLIAVK